MGSLLDEAMGDADDGGSTDASRWSLAWGRPLDADAAAAWRRLRDRFEQAVDGGSAQDLPAGDVPEAHLPEDADAEVSQALRTLLIADRRSAAIFDRAGLDRAVEPWRDAHAVVGSAVGALAAGDRFGDCEIVRLVARGGFGEVYEAIDRSLGEGLGRRVALKLLDRPSGHGDDALAAARHRDIAALSLLEHPSIARLYRGGTDAAKGLGDRDYLVTEFVDGEPLLRFVDRRSAGDRRVRHRLVLALGERLAEAIAASHAQGVVHRDIKSSNVLVREDESLAVVDFGIASLEETAASGRHTIADRLTMQPDAAGSLGSISPERARGRSGGPREDVWAIGRLLFEAATGRAPIDLEGVPLYEAIRRIGDTPPPPIREADRSLPRDLAVVVDRCLAFDPADRYPNAAAVRDELRRVRAGVAPQARPIGRLGRAWRLAKRHPAASSLAAAATLLLLAGTAVSTLLAVEANRAESEAIASKAMVVQREQLVRSVADGVLVEVAEALRTIPGATAARQRLLEIGLAYAEAVGDDGFLASDREAALELARAVFTLGEVHRLQQPNAGADELGREAFARAAELARLAAQASGGFDAESLGFAAHADAVAISGRGSPEERHAAWLEAIGLAESVLAVDPQQADALMGLCRACLGIGDRVRVEGDRDRAMEFFTKALEASSRLVEAHPDRPRAWFHRSNALNSMWWLLYTEFREGNESRILGTYDEMIEAMRRDDAILSTTNSRSVVLISQMTRTFLAIEFGLIGLAEAEASLAEAEAAIVAISEAEPEIGLLRRRRVEAHMRRGNTLAIFVEQARERGDHAEARRLAAEAARAYAAGAEVQRDRLARREHLAVNEDAMLAHFLDGAAAMQAVAEGGGMPP